MSFDARKVKIITELLKHTEPITGEYLSGVTGVSSRTIRDDIKQLNEELISKDIQIISAPRIGYSINTRNREDLIQLEEYTKANKYQVPTLPEDRVLYIIRRLLYADSYITMETLADELYVSKATVDHDIDRVEGWLEKYQVGIQKKPNYGIRIVGNEAQVRYSISEYMAQMSTEEIDEDFLLKENVDTIRNILTELDKSISFKLSKAAFENLVTHIAIAIYRIKEEKQILFPDSELNTIKEKKEYQTACQISKKIEEQFQIKIPDDEKAYITIHLLGMRALKGEFEETHIKDTFGETLIDMIIEILYELDVRYKEDFSGDNELIYGLALHLKPALNRIKYNMNLRNPLLREIKEGYPHAFEIALDACRLLESKFGVRVNENEVGYVAMHIGASFERNREEERKQIKRVTIICATGYGTAKLLAAKVKKTFSNIVIAGIYPAFQLEKIQKEQPDFILTTVPIEYKGIPVIEVQALLGKLDLEKIAVVLEGKKEADGSSRLYELFQKDLFVKGIKEKDTAKIIKCLSEQLTQKSWVKESFYQAVLERERLSSTSISNLVAIPHAMFDHVQQSGIVVGILEKPVKWGDNMVQLVLLLALDHMSEGDFSEIFDTLFEILDDKAKVLELIKTRDYDSFMNKLKG